MAKSPRLSFKGYSFGEALYRNKDAIKGIIAIIGGVNFAVGFEWKTLGISMVGGFGALAVKLVADAVDFYFGEVEL